MGAVCMFGKLDTGDILKVVDSLHVDVIWKEEFTVRRALGIWTEDFFLLVWFYWLGLVCVSSSLSMILARLWQKVSEECFVHLEMNRIRNLKSDFLHTI